MTPLATMIALAQAVAPAVESQEEFPVGLLVGGLLIFTGILDVILGVFVLAPRFADESQRRRILMIMSGAGLFMIALGVVFLSGLIKLGS